jgi:hypothetical protein
MGASKERGGGASSGRQTAMQAVKRSDENEGEGGGGGRKLTALSKDSVAAAAQNGGDEVDLLPELILARVKGFSWWPARREDASKDPSRKGGESKSTRKGQTFVYFFGTKRYGWVRSHDVSCVCECECVCLHACIIHMLKC